MPRLTEKQFTEKYLSTKPFNGFEAGQVITLTNPQGVVFKGEKILGFDLVENKIHLQGDHTPYWYGFQLWQIKPQNPEKETYVAEIYSRPEHAIGEFNYRTFEYESISDRPEHAIAAARAQGFESAYVKSIKVKT